MSSNWINNKRCPDCLGLNVWEYKYGNYRCVKCDRIWRPDTLGQWNKTFEAGRAFERELKNENN